MPRGVATPLDDGSPFSALIDAKLQGDRRIERLVARVRDLAAQLAIAEEHTRRALAQDLHDDTGASLTAANLALARAEFWLPSDTPDACAEAIRQARACLAGVVDTCHRIVEGLHEPSFSAGVASALGDWIANFGERTAIRIEFTCQPDATLDRLPRDLALALFRVMQEALGNVARHARRACEREDRARCAIGHAARRGRRRRHQRRRAQEDRALRPVRHALALRGARRQPARRRGENRRHQRAGTSAVERRPRCALRAVNA